MKIDNQFTVIKSIKDISRKVALNLMSESDAVEALKDILKSSEPDSMRWKLFEGERLLNKPRAKLSKTHRKRIKGLAEQIDFQYFNKVNWGDIK